MKFNIVTLFPQMFKGPLTESIIKRAQEKDLIQFEYFQLREFSEDKHHNVDDTPCGGGKGMVLRVDVVDKAIESIRSKNSDTRVILMSPRGRTYNQDIAKELSDSKNITLVCGHYEGFDERIYELADDVISVGDYVLTGGEIAAMVIVDSVSRLIPGVLAENSPENESFMEKDEEGNFLLEYPQYTRPIEYNGKKVPEVLLSGDHAEVEKWRREHMTNKKAGR